MNLVKQLLSKTCVDNVLITQQNI